MPGEQPQASPQVTPSGRWVTLLTASLGLLALAVFLVGKIPTGPSMRLKTCFKDVSGLRPGAKVRVAGVDIGTVRDIRAQPMDKACPGAVEMELRTPYELKIPEDSVASIANATVVFEGTYLEIDVSGSSGRPIQSGGQLPSKESVKFTAATVDRALEAVKLLKQLSDEEKKISAQPTKTQAGANPSPKRSPSSIPK
jgi:phospholipid/cholesterol/gamma-HCH transport system substrate-binding protein